jgi:hypothetical protein
MVANLNTIKIKLNEFIVSHHWLLLAIVVLLVYLSPNIFLPNDAHFLIHDNLDSNVVWYKNLIESGTIFDSNMAIVPNSLGGLPRGCFPSEFNFIIILFWLFPPLIAYNLNIILLHCVAFCSMYVFANSYIFKNKHNWAVILVSLSFAISPFWPSGGISVASQPLLLYAFLNILNKKCHLKNWLIIILIPFYSTLAFLNLFFIIVLFVLFLVFSIYKKEINGWFLLGLFLFVMFSVIAEYRLFTMQFIDHFQNHRSVLRYTDSLNLNGVIGVSLLLFFKSQYHFFVPQLPFVLFFSGFAFINCNKKQRRIILSLLIIGFLSALLFVLPNWNYLIALFSNNKLFNSITLRFYGLFPLIWATLFAFSICFIIEKKLTYKFLVVPLLFVLIISQFMNFPSKDYYGCEYIENSFYSTYINPHSEVSASFKDYYQTDFFNKLKKKIPPGNYYIGCLGFKPEVAQYNGYKTIDGYFYYYSLKHKQDMMEVSKIEMQKIGINNIDNHCDIFSQELRENKHEIKNLELNFDKLKELNTRYIFSSVRILSTHLVNEKKVSEGAQVIYFYEVL